MLKIKNNDIYLNRGEVNAVRLKIWNADGTPFILPPTTRYILNLAKYIKLDNGEAWEFYTPVKGLTLHFKDITEGAYVDLIELTGQSSSLTRINLDSDTVSSVNTLERITIHGAKLDYAEKTIRSFKETWSTDIDNTIASVLAFTVRAGDSDNIVMTKYLNLCSNLMYDGFTDDFPFGWNKFTTQDIIESDQVALLLETLDRVIGEGIIAVGKINNTYYNLRLDSSEEQVYLEPYEFDVSIPIFHEDTATLEEKEYTYDVIIYQGLIRDPKTSYSENEFPFKKILWKKEIIEPHKFVIGGSHNA